MFDFGLSKLRDYQKDYGKKWKDCRRWYKWLSLVQLSLSNIFVALTILLTVSGSGMFVAGSCLHRVGQGMGTTTTFYSDGTRTHEDHGIVCKIVGISIRTAGICIFLAGLICYLLSWMMLGLTFICLYEELNFGVPREKFILQEEPNSPLFLNVYDDMDRKSKVVRKIPKGEAFEGYLVYTGWVLLLDKQPLEWVYVSKYGKLVVNREAVTNVPIAEPENLKKQIIAHADELAEANNPDGKIHPQYSPAPPIIAAPVQQQPNISQPELPPV